MGLRRLEGFSALTIITTEGSCDLGDSSGPCPVEEGSSLQDHLFMCWGPSVVKRLKG